MGLQVYSAISGVKLDETVAGTGTSSDEGNEFRVGMCVKGDGNSEWQYVHASAACSINAWVGISEDGEAAPLTQAMVEDGWDIGVAAAVALSDNDFGWVCTYSTNKNSTVQGLVAGSCAADVALYTSATAGVLDDATSVGTRVAGVVVHTASTVSTSASAAGVILKRANDPDL